MTSRISTVVGAALLSAGVLVAAFVIWQFFAVDRCLDAGGSFNYEARECDMTVSHPFPGFWRAFVLPLVVAAISAVIGIALIARGGDNASP
jgi:ABC-type dipeptide/oligopeptide/nickel transport system permease component